jgi:YihY family inner membrane protein
MMQRFQSLREQVQRVMDSLERGRQFLTHGVWMVGAPGEEIPHGFVIKNIRVAILLIQGLSDQTLMLRAAALTFATLLFIVPFLALMFYIIQTFDLGDRVYRTAWEQFDQRLAQAVHLVQRGEEEPAPLEGETANTEALAPDPALSSGSGASKAKAQSNNDLLRQQIISSIFPAFAEGGALSGGEEQENPVAMLISLAEERATNPQAIGIAGVLFVLSTVFGFMRNLESSFNGIWGGRRKRKFFRAVTDYIMVTLLLPFVAAVVLGIMAAMESEYLAELLGPFAIGLRGVQGLAVCLTFSLIYYWLPNAEVRYRNALLGGIVAGLFWILTSWAYMKFQFGLARYALFFSTFALFPLMLMWLYASWLILLSGALLTYAYQHENTFAMEKLAAGASIAYREALAVRVATEAARRFACGEGGVTIAETAPRWKAPTRLLQDVVDRLVEARLLIACATHPTSYQPARSPGGIKVSDVLKAVRSEGYSPPLPLGGAGHDPIFAALEQGDPAYLDASLAATAEKMDNPPSE